MTDIIETPPTPEEKTSAELAEDAIDTINYNSLTKFLDLIQNSQSKSPLDDPVIAEATMQVLAGFASKAKITQRWSQPNIRSTTKNYCMVEIPMDIKYMTANAFDIRPMRDIQADLEKIAEVRFQQYNATNTERNQIGRASCRERV